MRRRCNNPDHADYHRYGARGITVCERWNSFDNFIADMGPKPTKDHSIERVENDKGYSPDNCIWGTKLEQGRNRRGVSTPDQDNQIRSGVAAGMTVAQISAVLGKSRSSIMARGRRLGVHFPRKSSFLIAPHDRQPTEASK
jgi:hypothetical protein